MQERMLENLLRSSFWPTSFLNKADASRLTTGSMTDIQPKYTLGFTHAV